MRKALLSLSVVSLIWSMGLKAYAQEKTPSQQPSSSQVSETERPKNEIERALAEAKERGETVYGVCLEDGGDAKVQDGMESGRVLELAKPNYPPIARAAHVSGTVEVQVIIGFDGSVIAALAISGHPLLQASAVSAARNSRFAPAKLNGKPVKVIGVLQYNFVGQ